MLNANHTRPSPQQSLSPMRTVCGFDQTAAGGLKLEVCQEGKGQWCRLPAASEARRRERGRPLRSAQGSLGPL